MNWGGVVSDIEHAWTDFYGLPPNFARLNDIPFWNLLAVKNETVPGISYSSYSEKFPPEVEESFNLGVMWSSSWNSWDGVPIDEPDLWQMSFCAVSPGEIEKSCGTGGQQYVAVTLRRLQKFSVVQGQAYQWENRFISDGSLIDSGTVYADDYGLLTIPGVFISPDGNRLIVKPENP
jgi:hypothetical protein